MPQNILAPAAVLVLWTMIMLYWMFITRAGAFKRHGMKLSTFPPGGRGPDLEGVVEPKTMWKAHNLNHLVEQPTVFYPAVIVLHLADGDSNLAIYLAWAYVVLRILHSIWQSLINIVIVRFALFATGSLCLTVLAILAVKATFQMSV